MNYKNIIKKQSFIITASIIVMAIILIGTSYALFINKDNSSSQTVQSGTLVVNYVGTAITTTGGVDNEGHLLEIEPMSEAAVDAQAPYTIKVTNTGTLSLKYNILIYTEDDNTLPHSYYSYKYKNHGVYTEKAQLTTLSKVDENETNMNQIKYKLKEEPMILNPGATVTHEIYVWIDEERIDDDAEGKIANLKIEVEGEATNELGNNYLTAVETVRNIVEGESSSSTDVIDKGNGNTLAYDGTSDNNLRYVGANPNNYVQFNNELWRIIGVMNNIETEGGETKSLVKIIRAESLGNYSWDTTTNSINYNYAINQWGASNGYEGADLMRELNTDYLGLSYVGTDGKWFNGYNNTKSADMPSTTISSAAQGMIENVVWNLGSPSNNNGSYDSNWTNTTSGIIASTSYTRERATNNWKVCSSGTYCNDTVDRTSTWSGKVALFYPSDYGYATSGGTTNNRQSCLNTPMHHWNNVSDCFNDDWLFDSNYYQWTLSPLAHPSDATSVFRVLGDGRVSNYIAYSADKVCPVVFLKSNVLITGGSGTQVDPYKLSLE